jgi:superfamily II DNA or RNA helicase
MDGVHKTAGDFNRAEVAERMDKPTITGDAVTHYRKYCDGQPCVVFCTGIKHAEHVAQAFNAAGYCFKVIDGTLSKEERAKRVLDLSSGNLNGLVSVDIVSEGFDLPCVSAAILLRPTASLSLHLQQIGRVLRPAANKPRAVILDHVGNCRRHGLAEEVRDWSLDGIKRRAKRGPQDDVADTRQCPECFAVHTPSPTCPQCLHVYEIKDRIPDVVEGELEELKAREAVKQRKREQGTAQTLEDLIKVGKARGMKNPYGWAHNVFKARQKK